MSTTEPADKVSVFISMCERIMATLGEAGLEDQDLLYRVNYMHAGLACNYLRVDEEEVYYKLREWHAELFDDSYYTATWEILEDAVNLKVMMDPPTAMVRMRVNYEGPPDRAFYGTCPNVAELSSLPIGPPLGYLFDDLTNASLDHAVDVIVNRVSGYINNSNINRFKYTEVTEGDDT